VRTAYAAADNSRLHVRVYVSDAAAPGPAVSAYIFIDSDQSRATGGTAAATNVDAQFANDPSGGGYEYVFGVSGSPSVLGLWQWQATAWTQVMLTPNRSAAEAGAFLDPIRINGDAHGYLQAGVDLAEVSLTSACLANLFVRTTHQGGGGDLDVGQAARCVPADANNNRIPDPAEPRTGCTSNAQCPNGGVCIDGTCVLAPACANDTDCLAGERCDNGRCVAQPTNTPCSDNSDCGDLVCTAGRCGPCTAGGTECGTGFVCGPGGRCVDAPGGPTLLPGEEVQGGACTCTLPRRSDHWGLVASALLLVARAFRRRSRISSAPSSSLK
jgi:Cys-rich repeat protein